MRSRNISLDMHCDQETYPKIIECLASKLSANSICAHQKASEKRAQAPRLDTVASTGSESGKDVVAARYSKKKTGASREKNTKRPRCLSEEEFSYYSYDSETDITRKRHKA